jgi:hypothetical protein
VSDFGNPVCCGNCRYWQVLASLDPDQVAGEPHVGICAVRTVLESRTPKGFERAGVALLRPVLTRPRDACVAHETGERLGRWWHYDLGHFAIDEER